MSVVSVPAASRYVLWQITGVVHPAATSSLTFSLFCALSLACKMETPKVFMSFKLVFSSVTPIPSNSLVKDFRAYTLVHFLMGAYGGNH